MPHLLTTPLAHTDLFSLVMGFILMNFHWNSEISYLTYSQIQWQQEKSTIAIFLVHSLVFFFVRHIQSQSKSIKWDLWIFIVKCIKSDKYLQIEWIFLSPFLQKKEAQKDPGNLCYATSNLLLISLNSFAYWIYSLVRNSKLQKQQRCPREMRMRR